MQKENVAWFASWFDTPYYHILYKDRDYSEAAQFMSNLTTFLNLEEGSKILDLACGKGRHARYLNKIGFNVTGVDLSKTSIQYAKQFENKTLRFKVHDMRLPFATKFDAVFNLFTSFGYFKNDIDNLKTIKAIKSNLTPNGYGVIDFLNTTFVADNLVKKEEKYIEGINFYITREIDKTHIIKNIEFKAEGKDYFFTEKVRALSLEDFKVYLEKAELKLINTFGSYNLSNFDSKTSERLILIFK